MSFNCNGCLRHYGTGKKPDPTVWGPSHSQINKLRRKSHATLIGQRTNGKTYPETHYCPNCANSLREMGAPIHSPRSFTRRIVEIEPDYKPTRRDHDREWGHQSTLSPWGARRF